MIVRSTANALLRAPLHPIVLRHRTLPRCAPTTRTTFLPVASRTFPVRCLTTPRDADTEMETLQDLYATAKDEFEIAAEETEKKTVYAADDREAAKEALQTLKNAYGKVVTTSSPDVATEIKSRVGQRIRELDNAVTAMEESAMED